MDNLKDKEQLFWEIFEKKLKETAYPFEVDTKGSLSRILLNNKNDGVDDFKMITFFDKGNIWVKNGEINVCSFQNLSFNDSEQISNVIMEIIDKILTFNRGYVSKKVFRENKKSDISTDFTKLVSGKVYGTSSKTIYSKLCDTLNWDKTKIDQFGWHTRLYAENADTNRNLDVWFLFYANYDKDYIDNVVSDAHVINLIQNDGDEIFEVVDDRLGHSHEAGRVVFVKTYSGYEFLGVYELVQNGTLRVYKRISKVYPMQK